MSVFRHFLKDECILIFAVMRCTKRVSRNWQELYTMLPKQVLRQLEFRHGGASSDRPEIYPALGSDKASECRVDVFGKRLLPGNPILSGLAEESVQLNKMPKPIKEQKPNG
jgi:hypothetical protein